MPNSRKQYDAQFKLQVVLETFQKDITIEKVAIRHGLAVSVLNKWRSQFKQGAHLAFDSSLKLGSAKPKPENSPEYLKKVIGDLTVENSILKKALSVWD
jgi:transposase-like protein